MFKNLDDVLAFKKADEQNLYELTFDEIIQKYLDEDMKNLQKGKKGNKVANFVRDEMIAKSFNCGYKKTYITCNIKSARAIVGLAFLINNGSLDFYLKPIDSKTYNLYFRFFSECLSNSEITSINNRLLLNIPLNEKEEQQQEYEKDIFQLEEEKQIIEDLKSNKKQMGVLEDEKVFYN